MPRSNQDRAERARQALADYIIDDPHADIEQHVGDLLSDLRHLCDAEKLNFSKCDRMGYNHYTAEKAGRD